MSTTLNLVDRLLARGRRLRQAGRTFDALSLFHRLAAFRELPTGVAEETQLHLAELRLDGRQFRRARRHLTAALRHRATLGDRVHVQAPGLARGQRLMRTISEPLRTKVVEPMRSRNNAESFNRRLRGGAILAGHSTLSTTRNRA